MPLLLLKLVLVPALIVSVTLGARRWGPRVGGLLASFPIVAGPTLLFYAIEQGPAFTRDAARATLVSIIGVAVSGLVYAWASLRTPWWASVAASWASFVVTTLTLNSVPWPPALALGAAAASFLLVRVLLPASRGRPAVRARSRWDLPLRMLSSITVLLVLTGFAGWLGPTLSGAFTAFPSALGILLVFTHVQQGSSSVIRFLHGFFPGMWSFALFCFVLALAIVPLGTPLAFTAAVLSLIPPQAVVLWRMNHRPPEPSRKT